RAQNVVGFANSIRAASRDERDDLLGLFGRHGLLVADISEIEQGNPERDRHVVETGEGDRLLAALDLADEPPAAAGFLAAPGLVARALYALSTETLPEDFSDVRFGTGWHATWLRSGRARPQGITHHVHGTLCVGQTPAPRVAHSSHKIRL